MTKAEIKALIARLTHENTTEKEEAEILNAIVDAMPFGVAIDLSGYELQENEEVDITGAVPSDYVPSISDKILYADTEFNMASFTFEGGITFATFGVVSPLATSRYIEVLIEGNYRVAIYHIGGEE